MDLADFRKLKRQKLKSNKKRTQDFILGQQKHVYNTLYWVNIITNLVTKTNLTFQAFS